jgi:cytochrome c-type biogenesis protein CcmH/NrfG
MERDCMARARTAQDVARAPAGNHEVFRDHLDEIDRDHRVGPVTGQKVLIVRLAQAQPERQARCAVGFHRRAFRAM